MNMWFRFGRWKSRPSWQWALPLLAALVLLVYGSIFLQPGWVLSRTDQDLYLGIWGLDFVFGELKRGNLPLWNPYILCGTPLFAAFQSLTLYPLAWPFMILPLAPATNGFILFHVWWMGVGMFWWLSRRGLRPWAALVGATLLMFGSTTTLQIYPGHITVLAAMSWMPFLLVVFDALCDEERKLPWVLLGMFFVAMQIAAGFPQHVFYTAGAGGIYLLSRLIAARQYSVRRRLLSFAWFGAVYAGAALLMMVQLLTSWQATKETARAAALSFKFIGMCSYPPENFLTLLAPSLLGNDNQLVYWGRGFSWEDIFYFGIVGLLLAVWSLWSRRRVRWLFLGLAVSLMWLALGKYTPLLRVLYEHVPVFGSFRVPARALFEASVFLCGLAALGLDALLQRDAAPSSRALKGHGTAAIALGIVMLLAALWLVGESANPVWQSVFRSIEHTREYFVPPSTFRSPMLHELAPVMAMRALLLGAVVCAGAGVLLRFASHSKRAAYWLGALAIAEICWFAHDVTPRFPLTSANQPHIEAFLKKHPGDYRFIKSDFNNLAFKWRASDLGGYESFRLRRYDEFAQWSQGKDPDVFPPALYFEKLRPYYRMLRCRYAFDGAQPPRALEGALPHALIVNNYQIVRDRDAIFRRIASPRFDARHEVILENDPPFPNNKVSAPKTTGHVSVRVLDTDTMEIETQTAQPAMLLITDSYSTGWKATALPGSTQHEYSLMPANYILRAIPLQAGKHRIRLEYLPAGFVIGKWISIVAWLTFGVFCSSTFALRWRRRSNPAIG
jgi:hypothetical protein